MHFGCRNQNSETTFIDQNHPQNPRLDHLGTQIGPRKVIFGHFNDFGHFPIEIPIEVTSTVMPSVPALSRPGPHSIAHRHGVTITATDVVTLASVCIPSKVSAVSEI